MKDTDIYLDVPHVWQEDPEHDIDPAVAKTICAIAAMKMIIDFLPPKTDDTLRLADIRDWMIQHHGLNAESDWLHSHQVEYLNSLGLTAWRRNWQAPSQDPLWFVENEDYNPLQIEMFLQQRKVEQLLQDDTQKAKQSFIDAFEYGCPVIVSVRKGFDEHGGNHQIVINGYKNDATGEYFYYTDPIEDPDVHTKGKKIITDRFFEYFNYRAIFARPA